jgi:hypothetical protein
VRLLPNFQNDSTFGKSGLMAVPLTSGDDRACGGVVLANGSIVMAGTMTPTDGGSPRIELTRLLAPHTSGSISGIVYHDENNDGIREGTDYSSIQNVKVYLDLNRNGNPDAGEPSTATNYNYVFTGLAAGSYLVRAVLPPGYHQTSPAGGAGASVTLSTGTAVGEIDFGASNAVAVPIGNPGGAYSVAEGSSITLDGSKSSESGGTITAYAWDFNYDGKLFTTDATGVKPNFSAAGLDGPSTRTIAIMVSDGSGQYAVATTTVTITNAPPTAKFAAAGSVKLGSAGAVSFSAQTDPSPADVAAGFKYSYDFNNDGVFEITDSSSASAAVPATYLASVGIHTIHGRIKDKDGGVTDYTTTITVTASTTLASISGTVFADNNGNAKLDAGELGVGGRKIYIDKNKNGVLDAGEPTFTSGASGAFTFSGLAAGTYRVRDVLPSGWRRTSPSAGYFDVTVSAGQIVTGKNFAETTRGLISGTVFKDANGNGIKDSTELGLSGWVVFLDANNNGKLDAGELSFTTGSNGAFSFIVPAGTYHLREVLKSGFKQTAPAGAVYTITLGSGKTATGKNFGDK